jgi:hypothetical protein
MLGLGIALVAAGVLIVIVGLGQLVNWKGLLPGWPVFAAVVAVALICFGAGTVGSVVGVERAAEPSDSRPSPSDDSSLPPDVPIKAGQAFRAGAYAVPAGWRLIDTADGRKVFSGKVRNTLSGASEGVDFHLTFFRNGDGSEAARIYCLGGQMAAGQELPLSCATGTGWPGAGVKYDRITVTLGLLEPGSIHIGG